jgi:hypothetical protein
MNRSSLSYLLALDRQRELLAQAESSPRSEPRRIAGTANPRGRRRDRLRLRGAGITTALCRSVGRSRSSEDVPEAADSPVDRRTT